VFLVGYYSRNIRLISQAIINFYSLYVLLEKINMCKRMNVLRNSLTSICNTICEVSYISLPFP
jgi:hypothetical protein